MTGNVGALVSVVIPSRNRLRLVLRALESLRAQTWPYIETIVVDDGSSEDFSALPDKYSGAITLIRNKTRLGAQQSRLAGARASNGAFVALLDSDDWWAPEKLECQVRAFTSGLGTLFSSRVQIFTATNGVKIAPRRLYQAHERVEEYWFARRGLLQTSTLMAPRQVMIELLSATADTSVHNDPAIVLEAQRRGIAICQLPDVLTFCDGTGRSDRISLDPSVIKSAADWFSRESNDWSTFARRGYLFHALTKRYLDCNMRGRAAITAVQSYDVRFGIATPARYAAEIIFGSRARSVVRALRRISTKSRPLAERVRGSKV